MKTLLLGVVLIVLLGVAGFFYRNVMEQQEVPEPVACTMDAKMCPDGSAVGRTGPTCEFEACAFPPNVEFPQVDLAFAIPEGYVLGTQEPGGDGFVENQLNFYEKPAQGGVPHFISVYSYPIPEGKTGDEVILENTRYQPADMQAEDFERFETTIINNRTFRSTVIERFEAQVISSYFLVREDDVLRFDVMERDVTDWMEPNLVVEDLPEHAALRAMLETLMITE
jgi:hypothetical protein